MVMEAPNPALEILQEALRAKFHSLARYILVSAPYVTPDDEPLLAVLRRIAEEDIEQARRIAALIETLEGIPSTGFPDSIVSEIAYLAVARLARLCLERKRREAEWSLTRAAAGHSDRSEVATLLYQVAETDARQAKELAVALGEYPARQRSVGPADPGNQAPASPKPE